jgi:hypothetical protein
MPGLETTMGKQTRSTASQVKATRHAEARKRKKKSAAAVLGLPIVHADTAGIDIGATEIYVAVPADRDELVRSFGTFTQDLQQIAAWLRQQGIQRVAMESTGVYWIPLWQMLADAGFQLCLVNARHFKNVPGKKTDVSVCGKPGRHRSALDSRLKICNRALREDLLVERERARFRSVPFNASPSNERENCMVLCE